MQRSVDITIHCKAHFSDEELNAIKDIMDSEGEGYTEANAVYTLLLGKCDLHNDFKFRDLDISFPTLQ